MKVQVDAEDLHAIRDGLWRAVNLVERTRQEARQASEGRVATLPGPEAWAALAGRLDSLESALAALQATAEAMGRGKEGGP